MVRAKFRVQQVAPSNNTDEYYNITLYAVTSGSEENKEFFKWTPSGQITINTVNPAAAAQFKEGDELYVDFTSATVIGVEATTEVVN